MKTLLLLSLLPFSVCAEGFYVQEELADMVEEVVRTSRVQINIPDMATKYVKISQIDGMDVCSPAAKNKVIKLQTAFTQHPHMLRAKSIHGIYSRQKNGQINYRPSKSYQEQSSNNQCEYLTVTVR